MNIREEEPKAGVRQLYAEPALTEAEAAELAGTYLTEDHFDILLEEDADVFRPDGTPLVHFRKGILDADLCRAAYPNLRRAAHGTDNRGVATGIDPPTEPGKMRGEGTRTKVRRLKEDGTLSNTNHSYNTVNSGIIGYFDRTPRYPYCRTTAYNLNNPEKFAAALPMIQAINDVFKAVNPNRHAAQMKMVKGTTPEFVISGTAFTTVTVNKNWQTAVHQDAGDYEGGFGVMSALTTPGFTGCYFCLPRWRVGINMRTTDVLLADVHEWHGNTPIHPTDEFERISLVLYYREKMIHCGTSEHERLRAANDRGGLNDDD